MNLPAFGIIIGMLVFLQVSFIVFFSYIDKLKSRKLPEKKPFISFLVPTYNDSKYIHETIKSIYRAYPRGKFELFIINDGSKDNTGQILKKLRKKFYFNIIKNKKNMGKAVSLNKGMAKSKGEVIFIVDSDTIINKKAVEDIISRFHSNPKVMATSCGFKAVNKGFLASMQNIEYGFILLFQGSFNAISSLSLGGACLAIRRDALIKVGGFSKNALLEDMDLALKLNKKGWKVEQSFSRVKTQVPETLRLWYKQKRRWGAGFMQLFLTYPRVYFSNIFFDFFVFLFLLPFLSRAIAYLASDVAIKIAVISLSFQLFLYVVIYPLFSLPYLLVNTKIKNFYKMYLIYPYSLIYFPALALVYFTSYFIGIYKFLTLKKNEIGWREDEAVNK